MSTSTGANAPKADKDGRRTFRFPSAFTVLFVVTIALWLLAFIVPTGAYLIVLARGVTVVMNNSQITDTIRFDAVFRVRRAGECGGARHVCSVQGVSLA